jgi:amidase
MLLKHQTFGVPDEQPTPQMPPLAAGKQPFVGRAIPVACGSRSHLDLFGRVGLATVAYPSAATVPVGCTATGLPVGLQVVGPYPEDRTTLAGALH